MENRSYYVKLRDRFRPRKIELVFIAESPPVSGKYFYDPRGLVSEPLFKALMDAVLGAEFSSKTEGLGEFQKAGYFLMDATYTQVDKLSSTKRDKIIMDDLDNLITDLRRINPDKKVPIVLIKSNIQKLLEMPLVQEGFEVINKGEKLPFPAYGWQRKFNEKLKQVLTKII